MALVTMASAATGSEQCSADIQIMQPWARRRAQKGNNVTNNNNKNKKN